MKTILEGKTPFVQDPPFTLKVELTQGCNLRCDFCAIAGIQEKQGRDYHFMTLETAERVASEVKRVGWNVRVEFTMHGEPSMNPNRNAIITTFRKHLPRTQLMMTSNGGGLLGGKEGIVGNLHALFEAGLNVYAFDAYEAVNIHVKVEEAFQQYIKTGGPLPFGYARYPEDRAFTPYQRFPKGTRIFIRLHDISKPQAGTHNHLSNHAGVIKPKNDTMDGRRCARPFRELPIRHDGRVAICCDDWRGKFKIGDVTKTPIDEVWQAPVLQSARRYLYRGMRSALEPCRGCDSRSHRVGLLPDHMGHVELNEPNAYDVKNVAKAAAGATYAEPVWLPHEPEFVKLGRRK